MKLIETNVKEIQYNLKDSWSLKSERFVRLTYHRAEIFIMSFRVNATILQFLNLHQKLYIKIALREEAYNDTNLIQYRYLKEQVYEH
jgi:hypothetical protein